MKTLVSSLIIVSLFLQAACGISKSDAFIRLHVVKLYTKIGSCTGTIANAKSGPVILTAAHCRFILQNKRAWAMREDGTKYSTEMIAYNAATDLMVMTTPDKNYLLTAKKIHKHEKVHSITHGGGHDSFRTDGELMEEQQLDIGMFVIDSKLKYYQCVKEKNQRVVTSLFGMLCITTLTNEWSSMPVIPGSSGGAVLNEAGEIVGVVSTGGEGFMSGIVPLRHIQAILANN